MYVRSTNIGLRGKDLHKFSGILDTRAHGTHTHMERTHTHAEMITAVWKTTLFIFSCFVLFGRNAHYCAGERNQERTLKSVPPVFILSVSDLVQVGYLSDDVSNYSLDLTMEGKKYTIAGITLYRGDHFVFCVRSVQHGWLYYDGLCGKLRKWS